MKASTLLNTKSIRLPVILLLHPYLDLFKNHPITQDMHDWRGVNIIVLHMRSGLQKGAFSYSVVEMV